jgi:hypothetical protein
MPGTPRSPSLVWAMPFPVGELEAIPRVLRTSPSDSFVRGTKLYE